VLSTRASSLWSGLALTKVGGNVGEGIWSLRARGLVRISGIDGVHAGLFVGPSNVHLRDISIGTVIVAGARQYLSLHACTRRLADDSDFAGACGKRARSVNSPS
jgi:hypothetical protein